MKKSKKTIYRSNVEKGFSKYNELLQKVGTFKKDVKTNEETDNLLEMKLLKKNMKRYGSEEALRITDIQVKLFRMINEYTEEWQSLQSYIDDVKYYINSGNFDGETYSIIILKEDEVIYNANESVIIDFLEIVFEFKNAKVTTSANGNAKRFDFLIKS
jgi:Icc-related predicted phosphoesterase